MGLWDLGRGGWVMSGPVQAPFRLAFGAANSAPFAVPKVPPAPTVVVPGIRDEPVLR